MKTSLARALNILMVLAFILAACTTPAPEPAPTTAPTAAPVEPAATNASQPTQAPVAAEGEPIYLSIIWHQHQPVYFKDPETGVYSKPWVRVHATKDYVDMAAILEEYPDIHTTFNLTPSLIRQLDDLQAGAKDLYWTTAEVPADQLTGEQKQFLMDRFFDTNPKVIARFSRYQDLSEKRAASNNSLEAFTTQDYLDLQVLFNLAWVDPDWLAEEPLAGLAAKGANFSEVDKEFLFAEHVRLIAEVIPIHRKLQDAGQIEVTMTPFAHPILPLLVSTDLAQVALPDIELPAKKFTYGQDAAAQVELGVQLYMDHFGQPPRGMWPAEGSVAQEIVSMVARNGIYWMASDEGVLANSLGTTSFTRNSEEVVTEPDKLYRPYYVEGSQGGPVAMVFRDVVISDKVGFTYSGVPGKAAAADFINRIHAIREALIESGAEGPHLVSVILDGENAWEHYQNDGKEFLHSLYAGLSIDPAIKTVTPTEFLALAPEQPKIEKLWAGSWISHDFSTWIGEEEENQAWEHLVTTRELLQKYENGVRQTPSAEALEQAKILMYIAEGSDWFWWYGADQNSGDDESFDQQYRDTLKQIYLTLGETPPEDLDVPIIPLQAVSADRPSAGLISPEVDGALDKDGEEWAAAGVYQSSGGVMEAAQPYFEYLLYGFDSQNLYIGIKSVEGFTPPAGVSSVEVYLSAPGGGPVSNFSRGGTLLGFPANRLIQVLLEEGQLAGASVSTATGENSWSAETVQLAQVAQGANTLEMAIPLADLGSVEVGDRIRLRLVYSENLLAGESLIPADTDRIPGGGPAVVSVPDLGTTTILLDIADPEGDDHGLGSYTYPTDSVFAPGNFDILNFQVGEDEQNVVFRFTLRGPVENHWGSPNGLSVQTFDIYIDQDGDGQGGSAMLPGRNLALEEGYAWDFAITIEGWEAGIFLPGAEGPERTATASQFTVLVDPGQQKVTVRVPKSILGEDLAAWRYAAVVLGQEGYPAGGVMRVRDVNPSAEQWRFGGAPAEATNHTRVIDFAWPTTGEQEAWLSDFTPSQAAQGALTAGDFARVPMLAVDG